MRTDSDRCPSRNGQHLDHLNLLRRGDSECSAGFKRRNEIRTETACHTISIEACRSYEPSAHVYHYVSQKLGAPRACMMVAAPVWDTVGAQSAGFSSALIARAGNAPLIVPGLPQPNIVVPDLEALGCGLPGSENMS